MKFLKKFYSWEKRQWQKPETRLAVGVALGLLIGYGAENVGLGIALGVAIGVALYIDAKKKNNNISNKS